MLQEDCELDDGSGMAVDSLCAFVSVQAEQGRECSALQTAVAHSCANDCSGCDLRAVTVVLAACTVDGVAQIPGDEFCVSADGCSDAQHSVMGSCISNCDGCDLTSTEASLSNCVVDMDVGEGVRAADVRNTRKK